MRQIFTKYSSTANIIFVIIETLLVWLVITAQVFAFNRFSGNELDVLPSAKQFLDHDWLPRDWYLNLDIGYRQLFNYAVGILVDQLGFLYGAYAGRIIAYLLLSLALVVFFRAIRLRFALGLVVVLIYFANQSLIAGEWIAGGVDTKTFAYAMALFSFSSFIKRRYFIGFAFAGAALSFHVLIGIYALFCTGTAMLLTWKSWHVEWRNLIRKAWIFLITGIFGLLTIFQQLLPQGDIETDKAWQIYVEFRVPPHVLPSAWNGDLWILQLILAVGFLLAIYLLKKTAISKFIAGYALGSVFLFVIGLVIYAAGETNLLRFYWFRYPDVMIPFLSLVLVALVISDLTYISSSDSPGISNRRYSVQFLLSKGLPIFLAMIVILLTLQSITIIRTMYRRGINNRPPKIQKSLEWIQEYTPGNAVFLVEPLMSEFYVFAEKAEFVSFNHSPQSAGDILEWYKRIELSNGGQPPSFPVARDELQANFYQLDEDNIRRLAEEYGLSYYLGLTDTQLLFESIYRDENITIFDID
jgi:hypothetical protein